MRTVLWSRNHLEDANTARDGSGTIVRVAKLAEAAYLERVIYQSLGDNAVCVGRLFLKSRTDTDSEADYFLLQETTLAAKSSTTQTAAIAADESVVDVYLEAGDELYASVSVDLTSSTGYLVGVALGDHRRDYEAD